VLDGAHFAVVSRPGVPVGDLPARLPALASRMRRVDAITGRLEANLTDGLEADAPYRTCVFLIDAVTADVSSTAIRRARQAHQSIAGLVPLLVQHHIEQHGLYQDSTPTAGAPKGSLASAAGRLHGQD